MKSELLRTEEQKTKITFKKGDILIAESDGLRTIVVFREYQDEEQTMFTGICLYSDCKRNKKQSLLKLTKDWSVDGFEKSHREIIIKFSN